MMSPFQAGTVCCCCLFLISNTTLVVHSDEGKVCAFQLRPPECEFFLCLQESFKRHFSQTPYYFACALHWFGVLAWKLKGTQEKRTLCHGIILLWGRRFYLCAILVMAREGGDLTRQIETVTRTCKQAHVNVSTVSRLAWVRLHAEAAVQRSWINGKQYVGLSSDFFFSLSFCHSWEVWGVFPGGCALTIWGGTHIHVAPSGRQLSCFSMIHRRDEYLQVDRKWQKKKYRLMWGKMHFVPFYLHRIRHPGRCRSGVEIRKFDNF